VPAPRKLAFPTVELLPPAPPRVGEWLWTTRPGAERDLAEELFYLDNKSAPRIAGPSLIATSRRLNSSGTPIRPAFARLGFPVAALVEATPEAVLKAARSALEPLEASRRERDLVPRPTCVDVWVPDSDETNPLAADAERLQAVVRAALGNTHVLAEDPRAAHAGGGTVVEVCVLPGHRAVVGAMRTADALVLAPGGRLRVHLPQHAPSRAAAKLLEAFAWLDRGPEPGELCVDLGAAPGGWTWVVAERRANVLAIDPGALAPPLRGRKGVYHLKADAFRYEPEEPVDWLFCDMAFRPLEVAALLARWCRRGWARLLVANLKLPMNKKAEMLFRVVDILKNGGWEDIRARQLYHDRDEVTVAAVRLK
jgi:23S rRNA (cytidine2498-2'-O)-methyltransferase